MLENIELIHAFLRTAEESSIKLRRCIEKILDKWKLAERKLDKERKRESSFDLSLCEMPRAQANRSGDGFTIRSAHGRNIIGSARAKHEITRVNDTQAPSWAAKYRRSRST